MALNNIKKIFAVLTLAMGIACTVIAFIALSSIDINSFAGQDTGLLKIFIEEVRKDRVFNALLLIIVGYYFISWGRTTLVEKKITLNMNVIYKIEAIETDDSNSVVKISLKDTATGDKVTVTKETKYLNYFKNYIQENGETMPGSIAALV